jgi:hypothetical protein
VVAAERRVIETQGVDQDDDDVGEGARWRPPVIVWTRAGCEGETEAGPGQCGCERAPMSDAAGGSPRRDAGPVRDADPCTRRSLVHRAPAYHKECVAPSAAGPREGLCYRAPLPGYGRCGE